MADIPAYGSLEWKRRFAGVDISDRMAAYPQLDARRLAFDAACITGAWALASAEVDYFTAWLATHGEAPVPAAVLIAFGDVEF